MSSKVKDATRIAVESGTGNVFEDLGLPDAPDRLAKAELARVIRTVVTVKGWTQRHTAEVIGIAPPDVSDLMRGKLARFSQERLERFLNALDMDVNIRVSPRPDNKARANVSVDLIGFPITPTRKVAAPNAVESRVHATLRALEEISPDLAGLFQIGRDLCSQPDSPGLAYVIAHTGRELMLGVVRELADSTVRRGDEPLEPTDALESALEKQIADTLVEVLDVTRTPALARSLTEAALRIVRESDVPGKDEADDFRIRIASALRLHPNDTLVKQWSALYRQLQGATHVRKPDQRSPAVDPLRLAFADLTDLLFGAVASIFDSEDEVDRLSDLEVPNSADLNRLKRLIPRPILRRRFYDRLQSSEWIEPLAKAALFRSVPDRRVFPDGSWSMTPWPEGAYLLRMAPKTPQRVMEIFRDTPIENENPAVWALVADAVSALPTAQAVLLIPLIEKALRSNFAVHFSRRVVKAAARLANEGRVEAFELARALVWPRKLPVIAERGDDESAEDFLSRIRDHRNKFIYGDWWVLARFDRNEFDQFVPVLVPALEGVDRTRTLEFLCERLTRMIRRVAATRRMFAEVLERGVADVLNGAALANHVAEAADDTDSFTDAIASGEDERGESRRWCDDLVHYDESDGVRAALATSAFAVARRLIESGVAPAWVIDSLDSHANEIFRRMQWRLLAEQPTLTPQLRARVDGFLRSEDALWPAAGARETAALLRAHFESALPDAQQAFCSSLEAGPGEAWVTRQNEFWERADTPAERADALAEWQRTRLRWFQDRIPTILTPIAKRLGVKPDLPTTKQQSLDETGSWSSGVYSASARSPMTEEALAALSADKLVQYLATWSPPHGTENPWESPTAEGLRMMISAMATDKPAHTIALVPELATREIPLDYLSSMVSGLRTAIQQSKSVPVTELIEFASLVWRRSHAAMSYVTPKNRSAEWSAKAVLNLLQAAIRADLVEENNIESFQSFAREIVEAAVTWHDAPGAVTPSTYDEVLQLSTSAAHAEVIETVLDIAWREFLLRNPGIHWPPPAQTATGAWVVPLIELLLALPSVAGIASEGAVGSALSRLLWLAHDWTVSALPRLLTDGATNPAGRPAWAMYVTHSQLFDPMFGVLRPWYSIAAAALPVQGEPNGDTKWRVATALTDHVITAAVRGLCSGDDPDRLVPHVFDRVPVKTRTHAYWMVYRAWSDTDAPSSEMSLHVIEFWEWRLGELESRPSDESRDEEVDGLCWFIATPHLPPHDAIRLGKRTVALLMREHRTGGLAWTRLSELAAVDPSGTFDIVEKLILLSLAGEFVHLPLDEVAPSLRAAITLGGDVRKRARSLLKKMGDAGLGEYRELWESSRA